uniref:Uncharacterized protein n=1 Tax=Ciona savignyi TaxID=51511 RepID=H2YI83_CIOSA
MTNIEANTHSLTISDSHISTLIVNQVSASDHQASQMQRTPRSVCNVGQPVPGFSTTTMFQTVRGFAQHCKSNQPNKNIIIHCHGFPGTGKSQIVRKLAQEFPFTQEPVPMTVKWHIEC